MLISSIAALSLFMMWSPSIAGSAFLRGPCSDLIVDKRFLVVGISLLVFAVKSDIFAGHWMFLRVSNSYKAMRKNMNIVKSCNEVDVYNQKGPYRKQ